MTGRAAVFAGLALLACRTPSTSPQGPSGSATPPPRVGYATDPGAGHRPAVVFDHPEWLGTEIVLDIYEPLLSSSQTSAADAGELHVDDLDTGTSILNLSPARSDAEARAGALRSLPGDVRSPVRVRGELVRDGRRERRSGRTWRLVIVREITPLDLPEAIETDAASILAEPGRFSGKLVVVEDMWLTGFEASYLGDDIWLDFYPDPAIRCEPAKLPADRPARVRVVGLVLAGGRGYGHLGMARAKLTARELTYLDPARAGCATRDRRK